MKYLVKVKNLKKFSKKGLAIATGSLAVTGTLTAGALAFDIGPDFSDKIPEQISDDQSSEVHSSLDTEEIETNGSQAISSDDEMAETLSNDETELYHRYGC